MDKILLVNPPFPLESRYGKGFSKAGAILPSLGLSYVAAVLEREGYKVGILDSPAMGLDLKSTAERVAAKRPDLVGVTCLTANYSRCLALAKEVKSRTDAKIMLGGPHPTLFPQQVLENESIDYAIIGEGEATIVEFIEKFKNNGKLDGVKGIGYKESGRVVINEQREPIADLDSLPFPARHLLPLDKYKPAPNEYKRLPMMTMVTSRGCPYSCTFCCAMRMWGRRYRQRSVKNVLEEIKVLVDKYKVRDINFFDELWGLKESWINEFCDALIAEKLDVVWSCFARSDLISRAPEERLKKMAKAGCWRLYFGLESGCQDLLDNINKGITLQQSRDAVKKVKAAGIEVMANFMLSLPGETPEKGMETIEFAIELDPDIVKFNLTVPYPGTELYEQVTAGRWGSLGGDRDKYTGYFPVFFPSGYKDSAEAEKVKRMAYRRFYLRPSYILRRTLKIRSYEDLVRNFRGFRAIRGV